MSIAAVTGALRNSGLDVVIRSEQPYSQADLAAMQGEIHQTLIDAGYAGLSSGVEPPTTSAIASL